MMTKSTVRPALDVNRKVLGSGMVLLCVGGVLWLTGAVLSAAALAQATKKWIDLLEESPTEMAHRRVQQLKVAAAAGSKAWREQAR